MGGGNAHPKLKERTMDGVWIYPLLVIMAFFAGFGIGFSMCAVRLLDNK